MHRRAHPHCNATITAISALKHAEMAASMPMHLHTSIRRITTRLMRENA